MTLGAMCCVTTPSYYWVVWQSCSEFGQRLPSLYPISLNSKTIMDYDLGNMALASLEPRECSTALRKLTTSTNLVKGQGIGFTVKPNNWYHISYNIITNQYCPSSAGTLTKISWMSNYPALDDEKNDVDFLVPWVAPLWYVCYGPLAWTFSYTQGRNS